MTDTATTTSTTTPDAGNTQPADTTAAPATTDAQASQPNDTTAQPTVPESYDLKMPEGVELDKAAADEFSTIAKELKLDQSAAQKLADVGAKMVQRQAEAHAQLVESWAEQVKTDPEIGGDKLAENLGVARKALDTFGSPELKDMLNSTGLGNHPAVVKFFHKVGKSISSDGFVTGTPKGGETDPAKKLFPSMN